jgi:hypothetical protein
MSRIRSSIAAGTFTALVRDEHLRRAAHHPAEDERRDMRDDTHVTHDRTKGG